MYLLKRRFVTGIAHQAERDHICLRTWFRVYVGTFFVITTLLVLTSCGESDESRVIALTSVVTDEADEKVQERIAEYQAQVLADPTDANAVGDLGVVYELHGFSEEALIAYELATTLQPDEFRWPYYHSILLAARFDLEYAIEKVSEAIENRSDYAPAWFHKGRMLLDSNRFDEALECFELASRITDDPYAHLGQAHAYMGLNDPDTALAALSQTKQLFQHVNVQRLRATALIRSGDREQGSKILDGLPNAPPIRWDDPIAEEKNEHAVNHMIGQLSQAVRLIQARSHRQALMLLSELRLEYPTNKHVLHLLLSVYELRGDRGEALNIAEEGIKYHPDFYVFRTAAARLLSARGDNSQALVHLDRAIEIDPKLHWAYSQKAQLLMGQQRWLEASHLLDEAIGLKDEDADLYTYLGICLGFMDRWPEAANLYRVAISIDPKHVPAYINLARAETILKNEEEALEALENAKLHGASATMLANVQQQRDQIKSMQIETVSQ